MKKLCVMLVLVGVAFSSISCNMIGGAGKDIQEAGNAVEGAVN